MTVDSPLGALFFAGRFPDALISFSSSVNASTKLMGSGGFGKYRITPHSAECGVILYLPKPPEPINFVEALTELEKEINASGNLPAKNRAPKGESTVIRHYGTGAQILRSLGF